MHPTMARLGSAVSRSALFSALNPASMSCAAVTAPRAAAAAPTALHSLLWTSPSPVATLCTSPASRKPSSGSTDAAPGSDAAPSPEQPPAAASDAAVAAAGDGDAPHDVTAAAEVTQEDEHKALVDELTREVKELTDARMRLLADMENTRTIARKDVANAKEYAVSSFAKQLLEVADNLHLAVASVPEEAITDDNPQLKTLHEGVSMTNDVLMKIFNNNGIQRFGAPGDKFDPNLHDAMFAAPSDDFEPGSVSTVVKHGFSLKDRVLRPAQVGTVSKP